MTNNEHLPVPVTVVTKEISTLPVDSPAVPKSYTFASFFNVLRRRWALILTLGILVSGSAAFLTWYFVPVKYTAYVLLNIESVSPHILYESKDNPNLFQAYQRKQMALVKSRLVLYAALRQPKIAELPLVREESNPVEWLEKELKADFNQAPELMRVSLSATNPEDLPEVVRAVCEAYKREIVDKEKSDQQKRLDILLGLQTEYEANLRDRRKEVRDLLDQVGPTANGKALKLGFNNKLLNRWRDELIEVQSRLRRAGWQAAGLDLNKGPLENLEIPTEIIDEALSKRPEVMRKEAEWQKAQDDLVNAKRSAVKADDDLVIAYQRRVEAAQKALEDCKEAVRHRVEADLRNTRSKNLSITISQIPAWTKLKAALEADIAKLERETQNLQKGAFDLENYNIDIEGRESVLKEVKKQIQALSVELPAPSRVKIFQEPYLSDLEGRKFRWRMVGLAAAAGFGLVLVGVAGMELQAKRIGNLEEVKQDMGIRLMGTLPPVNPKRSRRSSGHGEQMELLMEAVDATRTVLLGSLGPENLRCIMVTSAISGEGKTSLACHLAASLARIGYRTLLVDGDLRRPVLHKLFKIPGDTGLGNLLREEVPMEKVCHATPTAKLWVMPAGEGDEQSLQMLARPQGKGIFQMFKEQFDFVIVDSAPVLPVADSLLLGKLVDGVLLSILRDVSRTPMVLSAQERLRMTGARILGAVVNGISSSTYSARYSYRKAPASA